MPYDPPPDLVLGPHVRLTVIFPEGSARAVAKTALDRRLHFVSEHGRKVKVDGMLTVFVHGESDQNTELGAVSHSLAVPAPLLAPLAGSGRRYALVVRDNCAGAAHRALAPVSTFQPGL